MTSWIVPLVESRYAEGRRLAHLYSDCPAVKRAEARGGVEQVEKLDGRGLCGVCTRRRLAAMRPEPVKPAEFYVRGEEDGLWLNCPAPLCGWQEWVPSGDALGRLDGLARDHIREAHEQ